MAHGSSDHHQEKQESLVSSAYNCYSISDYSTTINLMQNYDPNPAELFNLQTGMELLGIPPTKNVSSLQQRDPRSPATAWRGFLEKPGNLQVSSSSKALATAETSGDFYHHPSGFSKSEFSSGDFSETSTENPMGGAPETTPWQANRLVVDDSSLRCLFPTVGNDQANQGLSLSLFNPQHSEAGLDQHQHHTFEIRESDHHQEIGHMSPDLRDGLLAKVANLHPQQQQSLVHDARFFSHLSSSSSPSFFQLRSSKFLVPTQKLLNEFCSLGGLRNSDRGSKNKLQISNQRKEGSTSSSTTLNQSLQNLDLMDLQNRKAKLLAMLEEVDRRYRRYCEQMRAVVSSFETVAGGGSARVYSTLASKAMSRHFRCLRDGIIDQIRATKKAMGEKDPAAPGATRGETPRLKLLDQCLRQQKAFQQGGMMENHPWRPQRGLPERSVSILRAWLFEHFLHPYPSDVDKHVLARQTGLSRSQVSNWFINARVRLWKPMVEEMYMEETKELENQSSGREEGGSRLGSDQNPNPNNNPSLHLEDQKPITGHLGNDSDSLSSIINSHNSEGRDRPMRSRTLNQHHQQHQQHQQQFSSRQENFGMVDIDFSSYNDCGQQSFGSGVSLTLGLQQHDGGGMSLSFSSAPEHSLFFPREPMETCQPVQFSILDGDGQNLPYRNLMGTQLLHDLAG